MTPSLAILASSARLTIVDTAVSLVFPTTSSEAIQQTLTNLAAPPTGVLRRYPIEGDMLVGSFVRNGQTQKDTLKTVVYINGKCSEGVWKCVLADDATLGSVRNTLQLLLLLEIINGF